MGANSVVSPPDGQDRDVRFAVDFFIPVPGFVFNDFEDGRLTPTMLAVYCVVLRQADFETGLWGGSAPKAHAGLGGQLSIRAVQESLKKLCDAGYLKSFHKAGKHGNYIVAIDGYRVRFGSRKGEILDAHSTLDPRQPTYRSSAETPAGAEAVRPSRDAIKDVISDRVNATEPHHQHFDSSSRVSASTLGDLSLLEVDRTFDRVIGELMSKAGVSANATEKHREEARAIAASHGGRDLFVAALALWLGEGTAYERRFVGEAVRDWMLDHFNATYATAYIRKATRLLPLVRVTPVHLWNEATAHLDYLQSTGEETNIEGATPEQIAQLAEVWDRHDPYDADLAITLAGNLELFLLNPDLYVEHLSRLALKYNPYVIASARKLAPSSDEFLLRPDSYIDSYRKSKKVP
jgi:hypothetical protein